jgi:hypothetical protein
VPLCLLPFLALPFSLPFCLVAFLFYALLVAFMPRCLFAFFHALTKNLRPANNIDAG